MKTDTARLLVLAAVLAASPALAVEMRWGSTVDSKSWTAASFDDINGTRKTLWFRTDFLKEQAGTEIPLYRMSYHWTRNADGDDDAEAGLYDPFISTAYSASLTAPSDKNGYGAKVAISGTGTAFKTEWRSADQLDLFRTPKERKFDLKDIKLVDIRSAGDVEALPEGKVMVNWPIDKADVADPTPFPEQEYAYLPPYTLYDLYRPNKVSELIVKTVKHFLPIELALGDGTILPAVTALPDSIDAELFQAKKLGKTPRVKELVMATRSDLLTQAEAKYRESFANLDGKPNAFTAFEGNLLFGLVYYTATAQANPAKGFREELKTAVAKPEHLPHFVRKWRLYLMSELISYRDQTAKDSAAEKSDKEVQKLLAEQQDRVFKTSTGDAAQLQRMGTLALRGWKDALDGDKIAKRVDDAGKGAQDPDGQKGSEDGDEGTDDGILGEIK